MENHAPQAVSKQGRERDGGGEGQGEEEEDGKGYDERERRMLSPRDANMEFI